MVSTSEGSLSLLKTPITPKTAKAYEKKAAQLVKRWHRQSGQTSFQPQAFAEWMIALKPTWSAAAWRYQKNAVLYWLRHECEEADRAAAVQMAITLLEPQGQQGTAAQTTKTSAQKAKRFRDADHAQVQDKLRDSPSSYATRLIAFLHAARLTGLRPSEWPTATLITGSNGSGPVVLVVVNGKGTQGRSHGPMRTLTWPTLTNDSLVALRRCIEWARSANQAGRFEAERDAMQQLLYDIGRDLWPRRKLYPALYSCRHEFAAQAKLVYSPAEVAALMGHASNGTATQHYGRIRSGSGQEPEEFPLLKPNPAEVARVRAVLERRRQSLSDLIERRAASGMSMRP